MKTYQFSSGSPLARVVLHTLAGGEASAHLVARADMPAATLQEWRKMLCDKGARCVPLGEDTLVVTGFNDEASLMNMLRTHAMISGAPTHSETLKEKVKPSVLQNRSLQMAGLLNLTGDVLLGVDGIKNKLPLKSAGGGTYTLGALAISLFGNADPKRNKRMLEQKTAEFMRGDIGELAEGSGLADIYHHRPQGVWNRSKEFVQQYPAQVTLGAYTTGAFLMLLQGIQEFGKNRKSWETLAYGISSVLIKLASFLIPENPNAREEKPAEGVVDTLINWIREKPLRLFGFGSLITDSFLLKDAYKKYHLGNKTFMDKLNFGTGGAYVASDLLAAVSNKDMAHATGALSAPEQDRLEALSAEAIYLKKGAADTSLHADHAAQFLKKNTTTKHSTENLRSRIIEKIQALKKNPWVARTQDSVAENLAR